MQNNNHSDNDIRNKLEQALKFMHTLGMQTKIDLIAITSRVHAIIEELVGSGTLDLRAFEERRELIAGREAERMEKEGHVQVLVDNTPDKYALTDIPIYNCRELIPICKGRCCNLTFALSFQDLEEGKIRWNYGAPYQILRNGDGYCTYSDPDTRKCTIYNERPAICRTYDCRKDERIWKDFKNRIAADWDMIRKNPPGDDTIAGNKQPG